MYGKITNRLNLVWVCSMLLVLVSQPAVGAESPPFRTWWPIVNLEVEAGGRGFQTFDEEPSKDGEIKQRYGVGSGLTDWLFLELEGEYEKEPGGARKFTGYEIESRLELTQTKAFNEMPNPVDVGLLFGLSLPEGDAEPYEIESRLLLYKRLGPWRGTGNFVVEKEFGNSRSGQLELAYAGQLRYRLTPNIQPGLEAFGRLGEIDEVSIKDQQQKLGPGVFGFLEIKEDVAVKYEISWLFGLTQLTPDHSIKWLVEFEYKY